jgi:hypothetical protein
MPDLRSPERLDAIAAIWTELKDHVAARFRTLSEEVRRYPTPIARCDDQLPKLLEQRGLARTELERVSALEPIAPGSGEASIDALERFLDASPATDDVTEIELRARLKDALHGTRG